MPSFFDNFTKHCLDQKAIWIVFLVIIAGLLLALQKNTDEAMDSSALTSEWQQLSTEKNTIHLQWLRTLNPFIKKTEGDLLWNTDLQSGLMRFVNIPKLKGEQVYHLWVYDLHQPQQKPISASLFALDKVTDSEYYVPIKPEKKIGLPYKFLLTLENKGDKTFSNSQSLLLAQP